MSRWTIRIATTAVMLASLPLFGATFVVPTDRGMIERSHALVVGEVLNTYTQLTDDGSVETVANISIQEVIKGHIAGHTVQVHEPGGRFGDTTTAVPGSPRFDDGEQVVLFLRQYQGRWAVTDLVLGAFHFVQDLEGQKLLVRQESEIGGWDLDGKPHVETRRDAAQFLRFLRAAAAGQDVASMTYEAKKAELPPTSVVSEKRAMTANATTPRMAVNATYAPSTYMLDCGSGAGCRWAAFPNAVNWYNTNTEPGAPNGGVDAIKAAFASWNNDCGSNINYVYAGTNPNATGGLDRPDGVNAVIFETNLQGRGVPPYSCSSGGTIALGGVTQTSGQHTLSGETFYTTIEGDVMGNQGLANCTSFLSGGNFITAMVHELGHSLGFRHSNQDRNSGACPASFDCSTSAVMNSVIVNGLNGALQQWDINAARTVYPGGTCSTTPPTCTAPAITAQPTSRTITSGQSTTLSVTATGTNLTYQWYAGSTAVAGGTGPSITVSPTVSTNYFVQINSACGSITSATATVTVQSSTPTPTPTPTTSRARGDLNGDGRSDIIWENMSTGSVFGWLMNGTSIGTSSEITVNNTSYTMQGLGDFDGDGKADMLWVGPGGDVWIWLMNGLTIRSSSSPYTVAAGYRVAGVGDFNGDGKADIVWFNTNTRDTYIWLMNGTAIAQSAYVYTAAANYNVAGVGDFNRDGKSDLVWFNSVTGDTYVWLMNGVSVSSSTYIYTAAANFTIGGIGDFNADGNADFVWVNNVTGDVYVWLMNGTNISSSASPTRVAANFRLVGIGDFNGDGRSDMLWRNTSTGDTYIWLMNGTAISSSTFVYAPTTAWQAIGPKTF